MRKLFFALLVVALVGCGNEDNPTVIKPQTVTETFDKVMTAGYEYGFENDVMQCEYFFNEEYQYWGGFALCSIFDNDAANGKYENQFAAYNDHAASGDSFLLYYYDSYNEPCDILFKKQYDLITLASVKLNLTTYTYASITNEDINTFARAFTDGDYLKVVFSAVDGFGRVVGDGVECYVVDYRDGKRFVADNWQEFYLGMVLTSNRVRVTIETSDVGDYGANTPLYICIDDLTYSVVE
jgi:hypothetical protein